MAIISKWKYGDIFEIWRICGWPLYCVDGMEYNASTLQSRHMHPGFEFLSSHPIPSPFSRAPLRPVFRVPLPSPVLLISPFSFPLHSHHSTNHTISQMHTRYSRYPSLTHSLTHDGDGLRGIWQNQNPSGSRYSHRVTRRIGLQIRWAQQ